MNKTLEQQGHEHMLLIRTEWQVKDFIFKQQIIWHTPSHPTTATSTVIMENVASGLN